MNRRDFLDLLKRKILILDGGYGTEFFKRGYGNYMGEILNLKFPEVVEQLQREYVENGSDILLTNTFSANRLKLRAHGIEEHIFDINTKAVEIARKAGNNTTLVFGDISSTGVFPKPFGTGSMEELIKTYAEQAKILFEAGVDGFIVETMSDIKELKAAVYGIRSITEELPLIAHMTFDNNMLAVTGTSVKIFASTFEDLDVDVIGINCSLGPDELIKVFKEMSKYTTKPLSVEPNAGKPVYDGDRLTYNTTPDDFAVYVEDYIEAGVNIIGGCCGTTPAHIKIISSISERRKPVNREIKFEQSLTSRTYYKTLFPFGYIGERINPASRPKFQEEIQNFNYDTVLKEAKQQEQENATIIDVNFGIEKMLTEEHFTKGIIELDKHTSIPISFDIQTAGYLDKALLEYPGRPLINSARVTPKSLENRIGLLKKYGGMLILLAMGKEISDCPAERFQKILEGIKVLEKNGISRERILADPLVMSVGAKKDPNVTLETVRLLSKYGIKTTMGLSNLSFGLPDRSYINGSFVSQNINYGLTSAIMNTADDFVVKSIKGSLILKGINVEEKKEVLTDNKITETILNGDSDKLMKMTDEELKNKTPLEVSQDILGKAMEEIGELYSKNKIYLPQLLLAAETSQRVFDYLNTLSGEEKTYIGKVVMATVEGDIHDIGKKIVGTVLKSGGFKVIDAGKDVPANEILKVVENEKPDILGLSAMMTTTVGRVEEIVKLLKEREINTIVISGGASMNKKLADKFGAEYATDASEALNICKKLIEK